ncbi:hypothetical protein DER29_5940 [Micromonospora sp. M71_S20]|uniref:hypothetical protein n=1 Tax=Micromonospora sp. M71_S20 TaxID=592872 RepID=UPI000EB5C283|nr:hypothetical protein [Micromonospora sp. M71_S20]RLK12657.1 hypothetical protein DER29_5940 [Micromonospora sp. M71_S20]
MAQRTFQFELPQQASEEQRALAELAGLIDTLRGSVEQLAEAHVALAERVDALDAPGGWVPAGYCWRDLDADAARQLWAWLAAWTRWLVDRYGLAQDLGACWPAHPALVEELTALSVSWHHAYSGKADPDAPLRWHEALHRARHRWQGWDTTRCRHGHHTPRSGDTVWSQPWPDDAERAVTDDIDARQRAAPQPEGRTT